MSNQVMVVFTTVTVVAITIAFHYEILASLNRWLTRKRIKHGENHRHRPAVLYVMFVLLAAHIAEIWLFGIGHWLLIEYAGAGSIDGYAHIGLLDSVYFSAATYTTVGWGDLSASGHVRFLAGTEALVGFMMITWSASFAYLVMSRQWGP